MKLNDLKLQPETKLLIDAYLKQPSHALLAVGQAGVGLLTIVKALSTKLSGSEGTIQYIEPEGQTITIDSIRALYKQTRSHQSDKQVIIIDDADLMSRDAQNAFLKLLEEPSENRYFILTTHHPGELLPTVTSRAQTITVKPVSSRMTDDLLAAHQLKDDKKRQILFMASGLSAEITRLCENETYFSEQVSRVTDARKILESNTYDRIKLLKTYSDRQLAEQLVGVLGRLTLFSLRRSPSDKLLAALDAIDDVSGRLQANGHVRTQLLYLMTKLP